MALSSPPFATDDSTARHPAALFRQATSSLLLTGHRLTEADFVVSPQGTPNMTVQVSPGRAWVAGSDAATPTGMTWTPQGMYYVESDSGATLTISPADPVYPRYDVVYLQITDTGYGGSENAARLGVLVGDTVGSPTAFLSDTFLIADSAKWHYWVPADAGVVNGQLVLQCLANYGGNIESVNSYPLTSSAASVQLVQRPPVGNGSTECGLTLQSDVNDGNHDSLGWLVGDGSQIIGQYINGTTRTSVWTGTYDPAAHAYLRIRESGGTVYWETSPDGTAWTTQGSVATTTLTFSISQMWATLWTGYWQTESSPGPAIFDNFSWVDSSPPTLPKLPDNSINLATISVPAKATAIGTGSSGTGYVYLPGGAAAYGGTSQQYGVPNYVRGQGAIAGPVANVPTQVGQGQLIWDSTSGTLQVANAPGSIYPSNVGVPPVYAQGYQLYPQSGIAANTLTKIAIDTWNYDPTGGGVAGYYAASPPGWGGWRVSAGSRAGYFLIGGSVSFTGMAAGAVGFAVSLQINGNSLIGGATIYYATVTGTSDTYSFAYPQRLLYLNNGDLVTLVAQATTTWSTAGTYWTPTLSLARIA